MKTEAFDESGRRIEAELLPPKKPRITRRRRGAMKIRRVGVRVAKAAQHPLTKLLTAVCLDVAKGVVRNLRRG